MPDPLAARLVQAAAVAMRADGVTIDRQPAAATVAVLRELADAWADHPTDLYLPAVVRARCIADEIEETT